MTMTKDMELMETELDNWRNWSKWKEDSSFYDDEDFFSAPSPNPIPNPNENEDDHENENEEEEDEWRPNLMIGDEMTTNFPIQSQTQTPRHNLNGRVFHIEGISQPVQMESVVAVALLQDDIMNIVTMDTHIFPSSRRHLYENQSQHQTWDYVENPNHHQHQNQNQHQNALETEAVAEEERSVENEGNTRERNGMRKRSEHPAPDADQDDNQSEEERPCCCACHQQQQADDLSF